MESISAHANSPWWPDLMPTHFTGGSQGLSLWSTQRGSQDLPGLNVRTMRDPRHRNSRSWEAWRME